MAELGLRRTTGNRVYQEWYRGFESLSLRHVAANLESFAATFLFLEKMSPLTLSVASPFRKKSRSARLFACKRAHNGSLSLPNFCGTLLTARKDTLFSF